MYMVFVTFNILGKPKPSHLEKEELEPRGGCKVWVGGGEATTGLHGASGVRAPRDEGTSGCKDCDCGRIKVYRRPAN